MAQPDRPWWKRMLAGLLVQSGLAGLQARELGPGLQILCYHRITASWNDPLPGLPVGVFAKQIAWCARHMILLDLADGIERLRAGTLPPRALALTFDDGTRDFLTRAVPVLQQYNAPATVFLITDGLDQNFEPWSLRLRRAAAVVYPKPWTSGHAGLGTFDFTEGVPAVRRFNTALKCLAPDDAEALVTKFMDEHLQAAPPPATELLTWDDARALRETKIAFGAHTVRHPVLSRCDESRIGRELAESRVRIEVELKKPCRTLAYPFGEAEDRTPLVEKIARDMGFVGAVTTEEGRNPPGTNAFALRRRYTTEPSPALLAYRLLAGG